MADMDLWLNFIQNTAGAGSIQGYSPQEYKTEHL